MTLLRRVLALVVATGLAIAVANASSGPVVKTPYGSVEGIVDEATDVAMFLGVPFAAPPVGDLRYAPPVAPTPWTGTLKV